MNQNMNSFRKKTKCIHMGLQSFLINKWIEYKHVHNFIEKYQQLIF